MSPVNQSRTNSDFKHCIKSQSPRVIESFCPICEAFVAASPSLRIILIAEALHSCFQDSDLEQTA